MKQLQILVSIILGISLLGMVLFSGCVQPEKPKVGSLVVFLKDQAPEGKITTYVNGSLYGLDKVVFTVVELKVRRSDGTWITVMPEGRFTLDILEFIGKETVLVRADNLSVGLYDQINLTLERNGTYKIGLVNLTLTDETFSIPNRSIILDKSFEIREGNITETVLDFDVPKSIKWVEKEKYEERERCLRSEIIDNITKCIETEKYQERIIYGEWSFEPAITVEVRYK